MSAAFKVFLLIILFFGACWAYQFRARDLREWLEPGALRPLEKDELPGLRSPVERVIDPGMPVVPEGGSPSAPTGTPGVRFLASLRYEPPPPPRIPRAVFTDPPGPAADLPGTGTLPPPTPPAVAAAPPAQRTPQRNAVDPEESPPVEIVLPKSPPPAALPGRDSKSRDAARAVAVSSPLAAPSPSVPQGKVPRGTAPEKTEKTEKIAARKAERPAPPRGTAEVALGETPAAGRQPPAARRPVSHVVGPKETLASLARRYYGNDTEKWKAIFAANQERLDDPHSLPLGTVLEIPDATSDGAFPAQTGRLQAPARREAMAKTAQAERKVQRGGRAPAKTRGVNS